MVISRLSVLILILFELAYSNQSYILLQGLAPQDIIPVHRRQSEQIPRHLPEVVSQPEPSCAELRAMWRHMTRMARHSEITNEIPQFPDMYGYMMATPMRQGYRRNVYQPYTSSEFGKIIREPNRDQGRMSRIRTRPSARSRTRSEGFTGFEEPRISQRPRINIPGRFSDVAMPRDTLGMYGTVVHSPDEKARIERERIMREESKQFLYNGGANSGFGTTSGFGDVGVPVSSSSRVHNDLGTFGNFANDNDNDFKNKYKYGNLVDNISPDSAINPQYVIVPSGQDLALDPYGFRMKSVPRQKASCKRIEGKMCKKRDDCFCSRNQLQCLGGACRRSTTANKVLTDEWGSWHNGPVDSSALGITRLKRETTRTIVM